MEKKFRIFLPDGVDKVLRLAIQLINPKKIILFGSRARGDQRENSDFDLAFVNLRSPENWAAFVLEVEERPLTLFKLDLLNYESVSDAYRAEIDREGFLLYEG